MKNKIMRKAVNTVLTTALTTVITTTMALMAVPLMVAGNTLTEENTKIEGSLKDSAITDQEAKKAAAAMLPAGSILVHIENNEESYILKYYGASRKELYSVHLSAEKGSLQRLETQAYLPSNKKTTVSNLKEDEVHKIVIDEIKGAEITNTELDIVDGKSQYVIRFRSPKLYGNYTINAKNGFIEDRVIKAGIPFAHEATSNYITLNELKNKALDVIPAGTVTDVNLKEMHGTVNYQVEVCKGNMVHNLLFNAFSGKLLFESSQIDGWTDSNYQLLWRYKEYHPFYLLPDTIAAAIIDTARATEIAKRKAPQGELTQIKLYYYNGTGIYEGKLEKGKLEYYFKIDAMSGKVLYEGGDY